MSAAAAGVPDDLVQPFQIEASAIRGRLVRLGPAIEEILSRHAYPQSVATVLAEALALAPLLAGLSLVQGLRWSGLLPENWSGLLDALVVAMTFSGFTAAIGGALLMRRQPSWRVAPIGDAAA